MMRRDLKSHARLIVASSDASADMFYATGFSVPDPFVYLAVDGVSTVMLSDLEVDRGRRQARVDEVVGYRDVAARVQGCSRREPTLAQVIAGLLRERGVRAVNVPGDFPFGLAVVLVKLGIRVTPVGGNFWPEREFKTTAEVKRIGEALEATQAGMAAGIALLRSARIRKGDGVLVRGRTELTAEAVRAEIETEMLRRGAVGMGHTIVAGGAQACDPHDRGTGPLRGNELIILDVFPRVTATGYYGDLTRTVVRGRATEAQRRLWETCLKGQERALRQIRPGNDGAAVQDGVREFFREEGYPTEQRDGRWTGFFHGLGHGLGLEIHEEPRIGRTTFREGQVVTVEPGIYVPGVGGVRHEDVVVVSGTGRRLLSKFAKELEI